MKLKHNLMSRQKEKKGFTLVELLIVIVVIAIIAAIVILAYTGISQRAKSTTLVSDLTNAANQLKLYQATNSAYPTSNDCSSGANPAPPAICLKSSANNTYTGYVYNNAVSPQTFTLTEQNGSLTYSITNDGLAVAVTTVNTSGGTVTTSGGNTINTFTSGGTFTVSGGSLTNVSILVVGGGGGGGDDTSGGNDTEGGGGGGGQFLTQSGLTFSGSSTVTIGNGGAIDANGNSSSLGSYMAIGGGAGAHYYGNPGSGGSGGGAANAGAAGGIGTAGNNGGAGGAGGFCGGTPGGGGGAGGVGSVGGSCTGGQGGIGLSSAISGVTAWYAGGGSAENLALQGGGGNAFGETPSSNAGTPNTGGGGGSNGPGGSGIVIVEYTTP
jgi:prepilin-type N-terminal cleavage/methylation domain-containing protein